MASLYGAGRQLSEYTFAIGDGHVVGRAAALARGSADDPC